MSTINYTTLVEQLAVLPDPRNQRGRRYEWLYLLAVIAVAMISGQRNIRGMAQWARGSSEDLLAYLHPRRRLVPSATGSVY